MVHMWVYMTICSHIYRYLDAYNTCKHIYIYIYIYIYASCCIFLHGYLYLNAYIYADICVYRGILACIWLYSTSLLPPARTVAHDSKGSTRNCQMRVNIGHTLHHLVSVLHLEA